MFNKREWSMQYYQTHKKEMAEKRKLYLQTSKGKKMVHRWNCSPRRKAYMKIWRKKNYQFYKDKNNARCRRYYQEYKEKEKYRTKLYQQVHKEQVRVYWEKYNEINKKEVRERCKRWSQTFNGKISRKIRHNRRRAREFGLTLKVVQRVYEDNIKKYGTLTCYLCLKPIPFGEDHLEHKTPLSRGGTNKYNNLAIACQRCNNKKYNKTEEEFRRNLRLPN